MRVFACALLALVAIAVPGCGGGDVSADDPREIFVVYRKSGGIAGMTEELHLHRDGQAQVFADRGKRTEAFIPEEEVERLREDLEEAHLEDFEGEPAPPNGADLFSYEIGFDGHVVTVEDGSIPKELQPVIGELGDVVDRVTGRER